MEVVERVGVCVSYSVSLIVMLSPIAGPQLSCPSLFLAVSLPCLDLHVGRKRENYVQPSHPHKQLTLGRK